MSPLDASFLHIENDVSHMHIGSVGIFEAPAPTQEEANRAVCAQLPNVPRYRQKVRFVPMALGRPAWIDDSDFNIDFHVRRTALASPGGDEELRNLVGRVMSQQLDRTKPLWEFWIAEGLEEGRWALISKVHHCMVDGVAATDLLSVMLDGLRTATPPGPAEPWQPAAEPSGTELVVRSLGRRAASPYELTRTVLAAARGPRRAVGHALAVGRGLGSLGRLAVPAPSTSLNGRIGPHRRWDWARARLSDVKVIRAAHGGTVNDVVLTAITGGFRELLLSRGESVEDRVLRTLVPVSVRTGDQQGVPNNKVSAMFAELPVSIDDPVQRLESIHGQMKDLKGSGQAVAAEQLTALGGFAPAMLLALGGRVGTRLPQRAINTVTTNVPGPQQPLYFCGRRMLEAFPYVPLGSSVRIGIAIFSYDGGINFGVTGDRDTASDIGVLCAGIESSMAELLPAAPAQKAAKSPRRPAGVTEKASS